MGKREEISEALQEKSGTGKKELMDHVAEIVELHENKFWDGL